MSTHPVTPTQAGAQFTQIVAIGTTAHIEYLWIAPKRSSRRLGQSAPVMVFLHEGLGSVAMWRDFPQQLCDATGCRGLVYSRPGYGQSTPRAPAEAWASDFMHRQAHEILPALFDALGLDTAAEPPWLFGHSDGGSIALLHAGRFPERVAGCIVLAPHILVEDISVASIANARTAYLETDLRGRLARYHGDPDSAFWGWNNVWLSPAFRSWNIEAELASITCPVLAIQGLDDEYGTLEQIRGITRRLPHAERFELGACGHSPHREQPQRVIDVVKTFIAPHRVGANGTIEP